MSRAEIQRLMAEHPGACKHPRQRLTKKKFSNGSLHYVRQCENCWAKVGNWLSKGEAAKEIRYEDEVPIFDEKAADRVHEESQAAVRAEVETDRALQSAEWWDRYTAYLETDAWRARAALVRERSRGLCEGCRRAPCVQVHHLSYKNVGEEFLWELVAVCNACHERAHHKVKNDAP